MPTCYLIGAGDFTPRGLTPHPGDLLIAADGGYRALEKTGLKPDLLVESLCTFAGAQPERCEIRRTCLLGEKDGQSVPLIDL